MVKEIWDLPQQPVPLEDLTFLQEVKITNKTLRNKKVPDPDAISNVLMQTYAKKLSYSCTILLTGL